jgi:hypothetical protein
LTLQKTAIDYIECGLSVIPTNLDKTPAIPEWSPYQKEIAGPEKVKKWFSRQRNIAAIGGGCIKRP